MPATPAWPPASTPRLFVDQPLGADTAPTVEGAAAHYLLHVMRAKPGDPLLLFDNRSGEWLATVTDAGKRALTLRIERQTRAREAVRSEEHTSELQSLMRISYAVFCLQKNKYYIKHIYRPHTHTLIINQLNDRLYK